MLTTPKVHVPETRKWPGENALSHDQPSGHLNRRPRLSRRPARHAPTAPRVPIHDPVQSLVRRVNNEIRRVTPGGSAPFFCECADACFHAVWLDVLDYDLMAREPSVIFLADGHEKTGVDELEDREGIERSLATGS
jgi:hypothetical protein